MKHTEIIADDWNKGSDKYYNRIYYKQNPFAALPQWIGFHARKEAGL